MPVRSYGSGAQQDSPDLGIVEPSYEALTLLAILVYPHVSNLARLAYDQPQFLAMAMCFRDFGTKELRSVPVLTWQDGISCVDCLQVCLVLALPVCVERASSSPYNCLDLVLPFDHAFMSRVATTTTTTICKYCPVLPRVARTTSKQQERYCSLPICPYSIS